MGHAEIFFVDDEDQVVLTRIKGLYPRMKFTRLINMVLREWLEQREKPKTDLLLKKLAEIVIEYEGII